MRYIYYRNFGVGIRLFNLIIKWRFVWPWDPWEIHICLWTHWEGTNSSYNTTQSSLSNHLNECTNNIVIVIVLLYVREITKIIPTASNSYYYSCPGRVCESIWRFILSMYNPLLCVYPNLINYMFNYLLEVVCNLYSTSFTYSFVVLWRIIY